MCRSQSFDLVAPYTGAWIETALKIGERNPRTVAPYTGAWIETTQVSRAEVLGKSHPTRVRGLKPVERLVRVEVAVGRTLHGCVD